MLKILKEFCCKEVTKSVPKYLKCAFESYKTTKKVEDLCPFDFECTEFAQTFVHFFSTNLALCLIKLFVSFTIVTPLAEVLFAPPPVIYPIIAMGSYCLSSNVIDDLF